MNTSSNNLCKFSTVLQFYPIFSVNLTVISHTSLPFPATRFLKYVDFCVLTLSSRRATPDASHRRASVGILTVNAEIRSNKFNRNSTLKNKQKKQISITFKPTGLLIGVFHCTGIMKLQRWIPSIFKAICIQMFHLPSQLATSPASHHIDELCVTLASMKQME